MKCRSPIQILNRGKDPRTKVITIPCSQCLNCRINRRDKWAARAYLESLASFTAQFWTLTFSDDGLAELREKGAKKLYSNFLDALRKSEHRAGNLKTIRSFGCLEFGTLTGRPHYHLLIFNHVKNLIDAQPYLRGLPRIRHHTGLWPHGHCDIQPFNLNAAKYVCKYTTKLDQHHGKPLVFHCQRPPLGYNGLIQHAEQISRSPSRHTVHSNFIEIDGQRLDLDQTMLKHWRNICREKNLITAGIFENQKDEYQAFYRNREFNTPWHSQDLDEKRSDTRETLYELSSARQQLRQQRALARVTNG